jgi:hypothetical protein
MWRIRRIIRCTKNLLRWLPIIWKDEQWDYYYILEILKHKLVFTADHTRKHGYHVNSNYDADRMMLCVRLIEKVQNEDYMMEMINDDNITKEKLQLVKQKQEKAKRILFKLLDKHIESWWD